VQAKRLRMTGQTFACDPFPGNNRRGLAEFAVVTGALKNFGNSRAASIMIYV